MMIAIIILVVTAISMVATIVWTVYFEENHMRQVIRDYIENIRGEVISIQYINTRGKVFIVEYKLGDEIIKRNVAYKIFGELEWL